MVGNSKIPRDQFEFLSRAIRVDARVLEIGTFHGVTAAGLAAAHPSARITSLDVFLRVSPENWNKNRRPNQNLYVGTVQQLAAIARPGSFDMILVDADHSYEACLADMFAARGLLASGGRLFAHDYGDPERWQGVTRAVDEFCATFGWEIVARASTLVELRLP